MIDPAISEQLSVGQTGAFLCPSCEGGQSKERSMTVHKDAYGKIKWYCFRASCGERGSVFVGNPGNSVEVAPEISTRPYTGEMFQLGPDGRKMFKQVYDLDDPDIRWDGFGRYILPIRKPDGTIRGYTSRRPWGAAGSPSSPKSLTYWNEPGPLLAWYHPTERFLHNVILVEDQLSAMRLAAHREYTTCAILGTGLNQEKVAEIQQNAGHVTIALDADATGEAFALARKWGAAFWGCNVLILDKDIKDMPLDDLTKLKL